MLQENRALVQLTDWRWRTKAESPHLKAPIHAFACAYELLSSRRALGFRRRKVSRSRRRPKSESFSWIQLSVTTKSRLRRVCGIFQCHIRVRSHSLFGVRTAGNVGPAFYDPARPPALNSVSPVIQAESDTASTTTSLGRRLSVTLLSRRF